MSPSSDTEIRIPSNPPEDAVHPQTRRKRGSVSSLGSTSNGVQGANHRRKSLKVTRACDHCKKRKAKCSGTLPCNKCSGKGLECLYDAQYSRGRPPTPPPFLVSQHVATDSVAEGLSLGAGEAPLLEAPRARSYLHAADGMPRVDSGLASRASPELDLTEVQGQVFDPTSGLAFLHRARKRLAKRQAHGAHSDGLDNSHRLDGDRPLPKAADNDICKLSLPSHDELKALMALYFDVCIATYRIIHRPTVDSWLHVVERNLEQGAAIWQDLGYARASIVLACLSVAMFHQDRKAARNLSEDEAASLSRSDRLFCASVQLVEMEAGLPRLDIAQARIIQTLYLLTSSRMNRAWETFGHVLQLVSALGMHRKESRKRHLTKTPLDYLQSQLRMRTFWTVYILDKYLGVIFGRPQHYHDDDIDQDFPDALEDEDITVQGPAISPGVEQLGCHIDALICNVK